MDSAACAQSEEQVSSGAQPTQSRALAGLSFTASTGDLAERGGTEMTEQTTDGVLLDMYGNDFKSQDYTSRAPLPLRSLDHLWRYTRYFRRCFVGHNSRMRLPVILHN